MTVSHVSGPVVVYGAPLAATATNTNPDAGPSITYGGDGIFDIRYPYAPGAGSTLLSSGLRSAPSVRGFTNFPYICHVDNMPAATAATVASGTTTALTMTTNQSTWGVSGSQLLIPAGKSLISSNQVTVAGLDMQVGTCTTAGTTALTSVKSADGTGTAGFYVGQPIALANGTATTTPLFTYITAITSSSAMTIANAAGTSTTNVVIMNAHPSLLTVDPYLSIGAAYMFDPRAGLSRSLSVVSSSASDNSATYNVTISGYDVFGVPMTETITPNGTSTVQGFKAFKYVQSVAVAATPNGTITVKTSDGTTAGGQGGYGINMRSVQWEYMNVFWNGAFVTVSTGWNATDSTSPATAITHDVRGTYAVQTASNGTAANFNNNTGRRLAVFMSVRQWDLFQGTIANTAPLFGVTQA